MVTDAPTVIVLDSRSTRMSLKLPSRTWVPVVAKQAFSEWKLPAARTGEGHRLRSLTTPISSSRSLGEATAAGWLDADPFQFVNTFPCTAAAYVVQRPLTMPAVHPQPARLHPTGETVAVCRTK